MNDLRPRIAGVPDANTSAVLYGLLQAQNSGLTLPLDSIVFSNPQLNTQAQSAANGNTTSNTQISAAGYGNPVTISYNQLVVADDVIQPNTNMSAFWQNNTVPVFNAPPGTYATTLDFTTALQNAGFPITSGDISNVELQSFWEQFSDFFYQSLGYQLLTWSDSALGYTSCIFVTYGPSTAVPLSEAFPVSLFETARQGDPASVLSSYNEFYLSGGGISGWTEGTGAELSRQFTMYSGLTVLDTDTSQANGGAEVSAIVTYANNPNYLPTTYNQATFWPFYSGSQTVYYNRYNPTTDLGPILTNTQGNGYSGSLEGVQPFLVDGVFRVPFGSGLGLGITDAQSLLRALTILGWNGGIDYTDIVNTTLPSAYGEDGTVVVNLTFQNSYLVQDGQMPITLVNVGPDMSVIPAGVTDFPASTFAFIWGTLLPNADGLEALGTAVWNWLCNNYYTAVNDFNQDEPSNWMWSCVSAVVPGSIVATTSEIAAAHSGCGFQATIEVQTPWQTSFQFPIYYDKIDLTNFAATMGFTASPGIFNLQAPPNVFAVPMRVIDWLLNTALSATTGTGTWQLSSFINYRELTNLNDLVLPDANGNLSFTITAPEGSNLMEGSLTIVIANGTSLAPSETSMASPNGGIGWRFLVAD